MSNLIFYIIIALAIFYTLYKFKRIIVNHETSCTNCPSRKHCSSFNTDNASSCDNGNLALSQEDRDKIRDIMKGFENK